MNRVWNEVAADAAGAEPAAPYPGLRPFLVGEADLFFGREQMADEVLVRLNERHMVVVHGSSGCGKSSLVAAGVLPQLARRRARRGLALSVGSFRPGNKPMQSLVATIAGLVAGGTGPDQVRDVYAAIAQRQGARTALARLARAAGIDQLCIVVDQFEELFRFAEEESFDEAQRFAEVLVALTGAADHPANWWQPDDDETPAPADEAQVSLLLTMRSEFLGDCARFPGLADAINRTQYLLPNMERSDLIRAIREPAEVFGGSVEHALAERMADDAEREQDSLPLVQHALMKLWRAAPERMLTLAAYEGAIADSHQPEALRQKSPLGAILAGHADGVLESVAAGDAERLAAAGYIFRALTRKDSEGRAIRCPQRLARLEKVSGVPAETTHEIVDAFRREGVSFLTPYDALQTALEPDTVVDISHEALIRTWPRMSDRTIDPADAQPIGWVEREAQEAMLWRWVVLHADFFEENSSAYLDGTTTDRIGAWFETLERRPEWARPYLFHATGKADVREEPEWQAVARLLDESRRRTWIERNMLRRWRKLGRWSLVLLAIMVVASAAAGWKWWEAKRRDQAEHAQRDQAEQMRHAIAQGLYVTNNIVRERNAEEASDGNPDATEPIKDRLATAAAGVPLTGAALFAESPGSGFVWVGAEQADGRLSNLLDTAGRPASRADVERGGSYRVAEPTLIRTSAPTDDSAHPKAVGLAMAHAAVRSDGSLVGREVDGVTHYWLRIRSGPLPAGQIRFGFAGGGDAGRALAERLRAFGYTVAASSERDGDENADVLYCPGQEQQAYLLAWLASRELARFDGMETSVVAPRPSDECGANAPPLRLTIDFSGR